MTDDLKPAKLGYRMPPEWSKHSATQLHWPHNRSTWPGKTLAAVKRVYVQIIAALTQFEPVYLFVSNIELKRVAFATLKEHTSDIDFDNLHWVVVPLNDVWARDCGPIFIQKKNHPNEIAITDWEYNAWGGKYPPFEADNQLPGFISEKFNLPRFQPNMVLEGGSIDINSRGDLLTTESVLLNPNRNPKLSRTQIESKLKDYLGVRNIIWLGKGLKGDDTDGHIDDLARFLNDNTILTTRANDPENPNYYVLEDNYQRLLSARSIEGNSFEIVSLPLPETRSPIPTVDGSELVPASYANFYICNGGVLVPLYDDEADGQALELFEHYFPNRKIVGINCKDLVWGQGSIHCITQQWYGV